MRKKEIFTICYLASVLLLVAYLADRVIVMHLTVSRLNSISLDAFSAPQPNVTIKTSLPGQRSVSRTVMDHEGVKSISQFISQGGSRLSTDTSISIKNTDTVTIYLPIATNKAIDENSNPFYYPVKTMDPVIAEKANITVPLLKETFVYNIPTFRGQPVTLILK